jgi:hypothetical protein
MMRVPCRNALARPPLAGCLVGGPRYDQVVDVGEVFHDAVAIGIPEVDLVGELHRSRNLIRRSVALLPTERRKNQTWECELPLRRISPTKSFSNTRLTIVPIRSGIV